MARIVLAWELGAGSGHLVKLQAMAQELRARGHHCVFGLCQLDGAEELQLHRLGDVVQAPANTGALAPRKLTQVSYPSMLHVTGFHDPLALTARLRSWMRLLQHERADLLIAEHAPAALIAAQALGLPAAVIGTGFTLPPLITPFPKFRADVAASQELLSRNETQVLQTLNGALENLHKPALNSLQDMFANTQRGLFTYAETDHYSATRTDAYLGIADYSHGDAPVWPQGSGPLVFGYLRPYKHLEPLIRALAALPCRVLLHIAQMDLRKLVPLLRPGMALTPQPVKLQQAAAQCDFFVHYAAHNTTCEMLLAGKPGLLLPHHQEQQLMAQRVVELGAALAPPADRAQFNLSAALRQLSEDRKLHHCAEAFAARYHSRERARIVPDFIESTLTRFNIPMRVAPAGSSAAAAD